MSGKIEEMESRLVFLSDAKKAAQQDFEVMVEMFDIAVAKYLAAEGNRGATVLAKLLGVSRGRIYQLRERGRRHLEAQG